ncbi:MAG: cation diffusion facilitator family transporter [Tissierellia bacterium]|nr:cation diffusion facilitator family transporter [Tissierellia bacterium]
MQNFLGISGAGQTDRKKIGTRTSLVGVIINVSLFTFKLIAGFLSKSIAITADAVSNLSDTASSIISLISFKISSKPPDKEHPFGHARAEYLFSSVVSMAIVFIGINTGRESIKKIINPEEINFSYIAIAVLVVSILAKIFLMVFYTKVGKKIESDMLRAAALDSRSDVLSTSVILIGFIAAKFINFPIDGILGFLVALSIVYAGFTIIKDTFDRIIGVGGSEQDIDSISEFILSYDGILGIHDLIIHDYGPMNTFCSAHAEVDYKVDIIESHDLIDRIESDAVSKLGIQMILHMDPLITDDPLLEERKVDAERAIKSVDESLSLHDFRTVENKGTINLIFDVTVPSAVPGNVHEISEKIQEELRKINPKYHGVITFDRKYFRSETVGDIK